MKTYKTIEDAIETKDIQTLRNQVTMLAYVDRDFSKGEMEEQIEHIENNGIKLKEEYIADPPLISSAKQDFAEDDFVNAVLNLKENFCDERLNDLKTIAKAVNAPKPETASVNESEPNSHPNPTSSQAPSGGHPSGNNASNKKPGFAPFVAIAAIIAAVIAFFKGNRK